MVNYVNEYTMQISWIVVETNHYSRYVVLVLGLVVVGDVVKCLLYSN